MTTHTRARDHEGYEAVRDARRQAEAEFAEIRLAMIQRAVAASIRRSIAEATP